MHKIVNASFVRRTFAAILDLLIAVFVGLGFFAAAQAIFVNSAYGKGLMNEINGYQVDSGLYYLDENGNAAPYDSYAAYGNYETMLVNYYTVYLTSKCPQEYRQKYDVYWYNVNILGLEDAKGLYPNATIQEPALSLGKAYFVYVEEDGVNNYDVLAIPQSSLHVDGDMSKPLSGEGKEKLLNFYYSPSAQSLYYNAGRNLYYTSFFQNAFHSYQMISNIYPLTIAVFLSAMIFYFLLPMVLKNGATLGKKTLGLCLLGKGGFTIKKSQVLLRELPQILLFTVLFLALPFRIALMIFSLLLLISYLVAVFTKEHNAIHDFIGFSKVINEKESLFFDTPEEQEAAESAYQKAMEEAEEKREAAQKQIEEEDKQKFSV